jgi:hypothetical protein
MDGFVSNDVAHQSAFESNDVAPECLHRFFSANHETIPPIVTCLRCGEPLEICAECFQPHGWHLVDCPVPERLRKLEKERRRIAHRGA